MVTIRYNFISRNSQTIETCIQMNQYFKPYGEQNIGGVITKMI